MKSLKCKEFLSKIFELEQFLKYLNLSCLNTKYLSTITFLAQSPGTVEYADSISAEG